MPTTRIPIDGLWRCLCPSFDAIVVSRVARLPRSSIRQQLHKNVLSRRTFYTCRPRLSDAVAPQAQIEEVTTHTQVQEVARTSRTQRPLKKQLVIADPELTELDQIPNEQLHQILKRFCTEPDSYRKICSLVDYLIVDRGEKPALLHYDALIRANSDAEMGSVLVAKRLYEEMRQQGIKPDAWFYHALLEVLVNHPDYIFRAQVMQEMKEWWFGLSPDGHHNLVLTHLRDREFELAIDRLEQMAVDGLNIQPWLYDVLLYRLVEVDELDLALKILSDRYEEQGHNIDLNIWYYLLDKFSEAYHHEGTSYVWKACVQTARLNPSDGMCLNVINLAGRYGNSVLATAALRTLSTRQTALSAYHYEPLLEAYVKSGDLTTAFRVLIIMAKAGIEPNETHTRPIYTHLVQDSDRDSHTAARDKSCVVEAWRILENMHAAGHVIPIAAANVVLEATLSTMSFSEGLVRYKQLHNICPSGPNSETFNILLRTLSRDDGELEDETVRDPKPLAMFLASEMRALKIVPTHLTYDRLILICVKGSDFSDAFKYLEEMESVGKSRGEKWWMRQGTATHMVKRCVAKGDERAWRILEEMNKRGFNHERLYTWAQSNWILQEPTEEKEPKVQYDY